MQSYRTFSKQVEAEFIERRSRFIGYAAPVTAEEEAIAFIEQIRAQHREATHNVYAYRLREGQKSRYSDDGEPQGTAGMPVLQVLTRGDVTDCAVVVTRYFGGVLLGAGGLTQAYSHGAALAVAAAGVVEMVPCVHAQLRCDYSLYGMVEALGAQYGAQVLSSDFGEDVTLQWSVEAARYDRLTAELAERSGGRVVPVVAGEAFRPQPVDAG